MIRLPYLRKAMVAGALALAPLTIAALPAPVLAQQQSAQDAAYSDLLDAINETVDQTTVTNNMLEVMARQLAAEPSMAAAEAASPGIIAEIVEGMRPAIIRQITRVSALYRAEMIAVIAGQLTPAEATATAAFYRSDLGRRLMGGVVNNFSAEAAIAGAMGDGPVTADQVRADIAAAVTGGLAQMSAEDMAEMGQQALANPALLKLNALGPGIQEVRVKMENEPLAPDEEAEIIAAIEDVFNRRFPE